MILEDARPYVARVFGDEALQFVWLSLKDTAGRVAQNCVHALAEGWREERMKRELFALNDHLLKVIGIDIGKNSFHVIGQPYDKRPRHSPSAARRRPIPCRSCSCRSPNRSAPASSELGGKLHRQIAGLGALQDFDHVVGGAAKILGNVDPVADQTAVVDGLANCVNRGQSRRQCRRSNRSSLDEKQASRSTMTASTRSLARVGKTGSSSSGVRVSMGISVTPIVAAAVSISWRWFRLAIVAGFTSSPMFAAPGIRSRANSSCFAGSP